jgi:hypothetical protein
MFGNTDSNQTRQAEVRAGQYGTIEGVFVGSNPPWIHTVTGHPAHDKKNGPILSVLPLNLILFIKAATSSQKDYESVTIVYCSAFSPASKVFGFLNA